MNRDKVEVVVRLYDKDIAEKITTDGKAELRKLIADLENKGVAITGVLIELDRHKKTQP